MINIEKLKKIISMLSNKILRKNTECVEIKTERLRSIPNSSNKRILFFSHDAHFHGAQLLALNIIKILTNKYKYEVFLILNGIGELESEFEQYATVFNLENEFNTDEKQDELIAYFGRCDIHEAICNTIICGDFVKKLSLNGIKTLALIHELPGIIHQYHCEKKAEHIALYADKVIFPSDYVRNEFINEIVNIQPEKVVIQPQGLFVRNDFKHKKEIARATLRQNLHIGSEAKIVLSVGIADRRKGIDLFVEVAKYVIDLDSSAYFVWIGNRGTYDMNEMRSSFEDSAEYKDGKIIFIDPLKDISLYFSGADVYLLPSREDPFPSVVLQSMDVGVPVVAFEGAGGFSDIVRSDTGVLVPYLDTKKMAESVGYLLNDDIRRINLGKASMTLIEEEFNFDYYVASLLEMIKSS